MRDARGCAGRHRHLVLHAAPILPSLDDRRHAPLWRMDRIEANAVQQRGRPKANGQAVGQRCSRQQPFAVAPNPNNR